MGRIADKGTGRTMAINSRNGKVPEAEMKRQEKMVGFVRRTSPERTFGIIATEEKEEFFFHLRDCANSSLIGKVPKRGTVIRFRPVYQNPAPTSKKIRPRAVDVEVA